jgi:hypothetical protein
MIPGPSMRILLEESRVPKKNEEKNTPKKKKKKKPIMSGPQEWLVNSLASS